MSYLALNFKHGLVDAASCRIASVSGTTILPVVPLCLVLKAETLTRLGRLEDARRILDAFRGMQKEDNWLLFELARTWALLAERLTDETDRRSCAEEGVLESRNGRRPLLPSAAPTIPIRGSAVGLNSRHVWRTSSQKC